MLIRVFEKLHLEAVRISADKKHFIGEKTGRRFNPVGFNYDHDEHFRLLEDYWHDEWEKVEKDFSAMRRLGANVVRIHLQLGKFLTAPDQFHNKQLEQLDRLVSLAKSHGMYLDLVGLGCYHTWDVPEWYDAMDYLARWDVQAFFWETLARRYVNEETIFCFDLMNEPVVPGKKRAPGAWLGNEFAGKTYIQFITLDGTLEPQEKTATDWLQHLISAIRKHDQARLITVGLVDWSLPNSSIKSGFFPEKISEHLDFISAHLYPEEDNVPRMIKKLKGFCVDKPLLIDETFHMKCTVPEHEYFLKHVAIKAEGFFSFYTDRLPPELDDGRNKVLHESELIFEKFSRIFKRRQLP